MNNAIEESLRKLSEALLANENKLASIESGLRHLHNVSKGKGNIAPLELADALNSLMSLMTNTTMIRTVMDNQLRSLVQADRVKIASMVRVLKERGILNDDDLKKAVNDIRVEAETETKKQAREAFEESVKGSNDILPGTSPKILVNEQA